MYGRKYMLMKPRRRHIANKSCTFCVALLLTVVGLLLYFVFELYERFFITEMEYISITDVVTQARLEKPSVLYLDHTGFILADEQPDYYSPSVNFSGTSTSRVHLKQSIYRASDSNNPIEYDPSIDDGAIQESYKWYLQKKDSALQCTSENPINRIVFLRSHRTGSHTIANIFYRYGSSKNLFYALPNFSNFQYYWPLRFHHSHVDKSFLRKGLPDFLINIARNDFNRIKAFAKETFTVTIMRDPVEHFQSVYDYIDMEFFMKQLSNSTDSFSVFSADPGKYIKKIINETRAFDPLFHLLKNGLGFDEVCTTNQARTDKQIVCHTGLDGEMLAENYVFDERNKLDKWVKVFKSGPRKICGRQRLKNSTWSILEYLDPNVSIMLIPCQLFDLGVDKQDYSTKLKLDFAVRDLEEQLDLVLILEYLDESLVLLQRMLCWDLNDVVYLKQRVRRKRYRITKKTREAISKWNKEDTYVYEHFNKTLWDRIEAQDEHFWKDVMTLKEMTSIIKSECVETDQNGEAVVPEKNSNSSSSKRETEESFEIKYTLRKTFNQNILRKCSQFLKEEKDFIKQLKVKQQQLIKNNSTELLKQKYFVNETEKNFWYIISNKTLTELRGTNRTEASEDDEDVIQNEIKEITLGDK